MNNLEKSIITTAVLIVLAILFSFIEPTIIGYVVKGTTLSYSDDVSLVVSSDRDYTWFLEHPGDVTSVRVDGRIQDQGSAKVYIEKDGVRYLIYDSFDLGGGMLGVTGFAIIDTFNNNSINQSIVDEIIINEIIINETIINQSLDENLTINNETLENNSIINETIINQTNNNETINNQSIVNETITKNIIITMQGGGSIDVGGMFEFNVSSEFDWDVNYDKVCTKWDINSVSMCYGAADCCALIGLASLGEWDDSFYLSYERYGSGLDNIVRSQVIYADYSIEVESAYSDIAYSGIDSKEADFYHETISFSDACEETCLVSGFNKTFYKIIIDVENTTLYLDRIRYSIHKEINEVPMLVNNISNMTVERDGSLELNLDDYFMDPENATLLYSYYKPYGFNVTLEDNMLTITPEEDFTESGFMFVTANGSEQIAVSNVFRIDVGKKIKQEKNLTLKAIKKDFKSSENARFNFKFPKANNKTKKVVNKKQLSKWESEDQTIEAKILDNQDNITGLVAEINELADGEFEIILPQKREFRPGLYSLEINFSRSGENTIIKQNFTWGVLAINTHKSMYTENENAFITMGVLDDQGFMVCNASVVLDIIDPNGVKTTLTTANGDIIVTEACYIYDVTERPDYYTNYDVGGVGTYTMNLTATTFNGVRSISDSVNVYNKVDFDVARDGHTRIFPYVPYIMNFTIKANKNYNGDIVEYVPASFNISSQDGMSISEVGDVKEIRWNKNLKKGDTINLDYEYDAPDISPEFYLLGEMEIGNWKEERYWQIASDKNWFYDGTYTASPAPINELEKTNISMDFSVSKAGGWTIDLQDNVLGASIDTACSGADNWRVSALNFICAEPPTCSDAGSGTVSVTATSSSDTGTLIWELESCAGSADSSYTFTCDWVSGNDVVCNGVSPSVTVNTPPPPAWSNNQTDIVITYSNSSLSYFNVTWVSSYGVNTAWFEHNISSVAKDNESMNRISGSANDGVYNYSVIVPAGAYSWRAHANDTELQWNNTDEWVFNVGRATSALTLTLNGSSDNITIGEDNSIWLNGTLDSGDSQNIQLYLDGNLLDNDLSPVSNYALFETPGLYNVTLIYQETDNFTYKDATYFLNVSDITPPNVTLLLPENESFDHDGSLLFYFNVTDYSDVLECYVRLNDEINQYNQSYINKSYIQNITYSPLPHQPTTPIPWYVNCTDSEGNVGASESRSFIVDKNDPAGVSYINPTPSDDSFVSDSVVIINISHSEDNPENIVLYLNSTINETKSYSGSFTNFTLDLTDGQWNFSILINDSASNNLTLATINFTIDTMNPSIDFEWPTPPNNTNQTSISMIINVSHIEINTHTIILYVNNSVNDTRSYSGAYTNFTFSDLGDGSYSYYVWLNDSASNTNLTGTSVITIDSTPPSLVLEYPLNGTWMTDNIVEFKYNTADNVMGVNNCSLIIDNTINISEGVISEGVSQDFTTGLADSMGYDWSINCSDVLNNTNTSETRLIKIDTTYPSISKEDINDTKTWGINEYICLNVTVTDTFSDVANVTVTIFFPNEVGEQNFTFTNETWGCGNAGGNLWTNATLLTQQGDYNWTRTYAYDIAGNLNWTYPPVQKTWTAASVIFMNITMLEPTANFELNESTLTNNNSFEITCNVTCWSGSSSNCQNVNLYVQHDGVDITTSTTDLISNQSSRSCGEINRAGEECIQTFNITIGTAAGDGDNIYELQCRADSDDAPEIFSEPDFDLTVNDFPVAAFTFPQNGSYLNGIEILNASASSDDQLISVYSFEVADNSGFAAPYVVCSVADENCSLNTSYVIEQGYCTENNFNCYLRLNVTDSDGLKNSTHITIQIDNIYPTVNLDAPSDSSWADGIGNVDFQYTPYDSNIDTCVLYHNATSVFIANETNSSVDNKSQDTFTINLNDGTYLWNIWCNDSAGNGAFNSTNYTINVDTTEPNIEYGTGTAKNGTYFNKNWIYVDITASDINEANITFYLYDSTLSQVNKTTLPAGTKSINFTNLDDTDETYWYNVTIEDYANNKNSTYTKNITLDSTNPTVEFSGATSDNDTHVNRDWIYVEVSVTESNFNNITFYLYDSTFALLNATNFSTQRFSVNFTDLTDTDEVYYYNITVRDKVSLEGYTYTKNITLDSTNPVVGLTQPANITLTNSNNMQFNYTPYEINLANCSLYTNFSSSWGLNQTDTTPTNSIKNSFDAVVISDGSYVWNVGCYDKAGNSAFNKTNYTIKIDTTSPGGFVLSSPANNTISYNLTPYLDWGDSSDANLKNYTILVSDDPYISWINYTYTIIGKEADSYYSVTSSWAANEQLYWRVVAYDNLSQSRNSSQIFYYRTDSIDPSIHLETPNEDDTWTTGSIVTFEYNVSDVNTIDNCSLVIDDAIVKPITGITRNTTQTVQYTLGNGIYNWSINCTDEGGNTNRSEFRNLSVDVQIPQQVWYETYTSNHNVIDLATSHDGSPNSYTALDLRPPATATLTARAVDVGGNGILIKNSQPVNFSSNMDPQDANAGYLTWQLYINNGTDYLIVQDGNLGAGGTQMTSAAPATYSSADYSTPGYDIVLDGDDELKLVVTVYHETGQNKDYTWNYDRDDTFVKFYGYSLGLLNLNISQPTTDLIVNESDSFNVSCNVSRASGWCMGVDVHLETNETGTWANVPNVGDYNLLVETDNPYVVGDLNKTFQANFTVAANKISRNNYIRCAGQSDYSNANDSVLRVITINDITYPVVTLNNPQNDTWDNDGNVVFYYTPSDNDQLDNCSLMINNEINQTNKTITLNIQNNFTLNSLNDVDYNWSVNCTDNFGNTNSSETWLVKIDTTYPTIDFASGTSDNDTYVNRNWIYVNVSANDTNEANITFMLVNSTAVMNTTTLPAGTRIINFTNLDSNEQYWYNVTIRDEVSNENSTQTRKITLDSTTPLIGLDVPENNAWDNDGSIDFRYTPYDTNVDTCILYHNDTATGWRINETNNSVVNSSQDLITISLTDGTHKWNVWCNDSAGNSAFNSTNYTLKVDAGAPLIDFASGTSDNNSYFNRDWIYVNVSVIEGNFNNITFYLYDSTFALLNATNFSVQTFNVNFTGLTDTNEIYYYNVTVRDVSGNENSTQTYVITLDDIRPTIDFASGTSDNNSYFNRDWIYINVSANDDNEANITFMLVNSSGVVNTTTLGAGNRSINFTSLNSNEQYWYNVTITDMANNKNSTGTMRIILDSTNPTANLDAPANDTWDSDGSIDFRYTSYDTNIEWCILYHNESTWQVNETNNSVVNSSQDLITITLNEGSFAWNVWCNDSAGNSAFNATNYTINVDTTEPSIDFASGTSDNNSYFNRDWIYVNVSVTEANYNNITFYLYDSTFALLNATNFSTQTFNVNFTGLTDTNEVYYYNVTVRDKAGNENSTQTYIITLDDTNPLIGFASGTSDNNSYFNRDWIYVNVSVTEANFSNITFYLYDSTFALLNATNFSTQTFNVNFTGLTDTNEVYYYNVTVRDKAGNENSTQTYIITLDDTYPVVGLNSPLNNTWNDNGTVEFKFTVIEDYIDTCILYHNDTATGWQANETNNSVVSGNEVVFNISLSDGNFIWNVWCNDSAGNSAFNNTNYTVNIDTTEPSIDFAPSNLANNSNTSSQTVIVNVTHIEVNPEYLILNWNGTNETPIGYSGSYTDVTKNSLNDGFYTYYVWVNDSAGNFNLTETRLVRVDTTPPVVNLEEPQNDTWRNNDTKSVLFEYNASDVLLGIANCSLIINGTINQTNYTIEEGMTQNFTQLLGHGNYNWSINCTDTVGNENNSETRLLKVDLTFPTISKEGKNGTLMNITSYICLNTTVTDTGSGVNMTWAHIILPNTISETIILSKDAVTSCDRSDNDDVYSAEYQLTQVGIYNWTITYANDTASNLNYTATDFWWNSTSIGTITANMTYPTGNLEINESEPDINYTYNHTCIAYCDDKPQNCTNVTLYAQYNLSGGAEDITEESQYLVNYNNSYSCGNLTAGGSGCNYTFAIRSSFDGGGRAWRVWCRAVSPLVGSYTSSEMVNTTINDHPVADFTYPTDGTWLASTEILNGSASTDVDGTISNYIFSLDSDINFASPTELCNGADEDCSFNTLTQSQCYNNSMSCYLRLNVTDDNGIKNSTIITIGIDNDGPNVTLDRPLNLTNISTGYMINASAVDSGSGVNNTIFWYRENPTDSWNLICAVNSSPYNCTWSIAGLTNGDQYELRVGANDSKGNFALNDTHYNITIDTAGPVSVLDVPSNFTNTSAVLLSVNATVTDAYSDVSFVFFEYRINEISSWISACNDTDKEFPYSCNWDISSLNDGNKYQVRVRANDSLGNVGGWNNHSNITLDKTPPVISLDNPSNNSWRIENVTFYYNVNDVYSPVANCSLIINGTINTTDTTITEGISQEITVYNFSEGDYSWSINCTDNLGNENNTETRVISIDDTVPTATLDLPSNGTNISYSPYTVNASVSDSESGVNTTTFWYRENALASWQLICSDETNPYSCSWTTSSLTEGNKYEVRVNANDSVGIIGSYDIHYNITIDRTPPLVNLVDNPINNSYSRENVTFYYNVSDAYSTIANCSLIIDGEVNRTNKTITENQSLEFAVYNIPEGWYNWSINCTDAANNENSSEMRVIRIDESVPTVSLDQPRNGTNISSATYTVNASATDDNGVGVNTTTFWYRENALASWQLMCIDTTSPYSCPWDIDSLTGGNFYQIKVGVNDSLGFVGNNDTHYNVTIDRDPPNIYLISPENGSQDVDGNNILFQYNVSDTLMEIANCSLILNGTLNQTNKTVSNNKIGNFSLSGLSNGNYTWNINCTDYGGNINSSEIRKLVITPDIDPPEITLLSPDNNSISTNPDVTFRYNVTDLASGITNCTFIFNNKTNQTNTTVVIEGKSNTFQINDLDDGNYTWAINCTDDSVSRNKGHSGTFNLSVREATSIVVDLNLRKELYGQGEIMSITVNTSDQIGGRLNATVITAVVRGNTTVPWWNSTFKYRYAINITKSYNETLKANYTITHTFNSSAIIEREYMLPGGEDLRVVWWDNNTNTLTELDRVVDGINTSYTSVQFRTGANISGNASNFNYYVYYGNTSRIDNAPANKSNVDFFFDGFSSNTTADYVKYEPFDAAEDGTEDINSTLYYNSTGESMHYEGTTGSSYGKSLRRMDPKVADTIIEAKYFPSATSLTTAIEIAGRINDSTTYYYFKYPILGTQNAELGRYNGGADTELITTSLGQYPGEQFIPLKLIIYTMNSSTVNLKAYLNNTLVMSFNDSGNDRITSKGGYGAGAFRFKGEFDNITVRRYVPDETTTVNMSSEERVSGNFSYSGLEGTLTFSFNTTAHPFDNYTVVSLASSPPFYKNGVGFDFFQIVPDKIPPDITLNYPADSFNTTATSINFNWTADDLVDNIIECNLTIDGVINISNVDSVDEEGTNRTVDGFTEDIHYWNITCTDDNNNSNSSLTYSFTVIDEPANLTADLEQDNMSILLNWSTKTYPATYDIFILDDYAVGFSTEPNVTGITDSNWTDFNANKSTTRFYKVMTVKGEANKTTTKTVGKYEIELINNSNGVSDWNLVSLPLDLNNWELNNGTNNGYYLPVKPYNCIEALWRYNKTTGWDRTRSNGGNWTSDTGDNFISLGAATAYWFEVNTTCNLTFVGEVPTTTFNVSLGVGWNIHGWHSPNATTLGTWGAGSIPMTTIPSEAVHALDRYNTITDRFEVVVYYNGWGWWPSYNNPGFVGLEPGKGYYLDVTQNSNWTLDPNT